MSKTSAGVLSLSREILTPDEWRAPGRARRERVSLDKAVQRHPVIIRFPIERIPEMLSELRSAVGQYQETLPADRREVLRRNFFGDFARKVVGVGSVGTEAFVLLLMGDRADEPLFLQVKEAQESVRARFAGAGDYEHQGERVARGQRMIEAATDELLGWTRGRGTTGGVSKDYYVRQLRDMKGSTDIPAIRLTGPLLICAVAPRPRA